MAYNDKFNFFGNIGQIPLKPLSWRYLSEDIRGFIGIQDTDWKTIGTYVPLYTLPVQMIGGDTRAVEDFTNGYGRNAEDAKIIVIPQGTICSLQTIMPDEKVPGPNSDVSGFYNQQSIETFFGVGEGIYAWTVPANGGTDTTYHYSSLDVEVSTIYNASGQYIDDTNVSSATLTIEANKPVGIAFHDIYQTILPGRYLNYQYAHKHALMIEGEIRVPFYNGDLVTYLGSNYSKIARKYAFAYGDAEIGAEVEPDQYGKFKMVSAASAGQFVGKVKTIIHRGPLSMNYSIAAYPGSASTSDQTAGWPSHLFYFVFDVLYYHGDITSSMTREQIFDTINDAIHGGDFGFVDIWVRI